MNTKPNEELRSKVREIVFEYGSTNKSVNLGEATDGILNLIQTEIAEAERRARIDEHSEIVWNPSEQKFIEQQADRIKELTEIEV